MNKINVGIIGVGFVGGAHIEALRRLGYVNIKAIAINDENLAKEAANKYGISKYYTDYHDLLNDSEIEAVHNCTPNNLHYMINKDIILSKKHILSEKPLTMTIEESEELLSLISKIPVVNGVNFIYRQYPIIQQIRSMILNDELGDIYAIHGSYLQDWLMYDSDYNWRVESKLGGPSRVMADIGSHWCDMAQYLLNSDIVEVMADLSTVIPVRKKPANLVLTFSNETSKINEIVNVDTEDFGTVLLKFDNGVKGSFVASQISAGRKNMFTIEIDGSKASVYWNQETPELLWIGHRNKPNEYMICDPSLLNAKAKEFNYYPGGHNEGWPDALKNMMSNFYKTILYDEEIKFATFGDAYKTMKVVNAILKSNYTRSWQKI
jgi:predicted dehydrogenase